MNFEEFSKVINQKKSIELAFALWDYLNTHIYYNVGISNTTCIYSYFDKKEVYIFLTHLRQTSLKNIETYEKFSNEILNLSSINIEIYFDLEKKKDYKIKEIESDYLYLKNTPFKDAGTIYLNIKANCDINHIESIKKEFIFSIVKEIRKIDRRIFNNINEKVKTQIAKLDENLYLLEAAYMLEKKEIPQKFSIEEIEDFITLTNYQKRILKKIQQ